MNRIAELLCQLVVTALAVSLGVPIGWFTLLGFFHVFFPGVAGRSLSRR